MKKKILWITLGACLVITGSITYLFLKGKTLSEIFLKNYFIQKEKRESIPEVVWDCLRHPKEMTLYSIDPMILDGPKFSENDIVFHGFKSLGSTIIHKPETQSIIAEEIENAITALGMSQAYCFWPRHMVRITDGKIVYDFLICFQCSTLYLYEGEQKINILVIGGNNDIFNKILINAQVPLPKEEK